MQYVVTIVDPATGLRVLSTRSVFDSEDDARKYASDIHATNVPVVVGGDFRGLRFDGAERLRDLGR